MFIDASWLFVPASICRLSGCIWQSSVETLPVRSWITWFYETGGSFLLCIFIYRQKHDWFASGVLTSMNPLFLALIMFRCEVTLTWMFWCSLALCSSSASRLWNTLNTAELVESQRSTGLCIFELINAHLQFHCQTENMKLIKNCQSFSFCLLFDVVLLLCSRQFTVYGSWQK